MDDFETCSWCASEVPDSDLITTDNGRICTECWQDLQDEGDHKVYGW